LVIDIHVHCFPDEVAQRSISVRSQMFRIAPVIDGTVRGVKTSMIESGVDVCVLQPIAMKPEQTVKMNRWAVNVKDERVISFGTIHPDFPNWRQEIKWLAREGIKGVKFHSDCQGYYVDDVHMFDIYEAVFNEGLIALFHSGVDRAFQQPFHCTPSRLRKVLNAFLGARIIASHMGGYRYWDDVEKYLIGSDIYFDTAYSIHELGKDRAEIFIKNHGVEKILFGTDSPWRNQAMDISLIKSLDLDIDDIHGILGNNAAKLLGLTDNILQYNNRRQIAK